jgi:hypothetical protein
MTPSGSEPATFRFEAQCFNQLRHKQRAPSGPNVVSYKSSSQLVSLKFTLITSKLHFRHPNVHKIERCVDETKMIIMREPMLLSVT